MVRVVGSHVSLLQNALTTAVNTPTTDTTIYPIYRHHPRRYNILATPHHNDPLGAPKLTHTTSPEYNRCYHLLAQYYTPFYLYSGVHHLIQKQPIMSPKTYPPTRTNHLDAETPQGRDVPHKTVILLLPLLLSNTRRYTTPRPITLDAHPS